jgi:hypothetical protein
MVIRQRAIHSEDKYERHHAILDAAERLLVRTPLRVANMAEVADEAGLAKGHGLPLFPKQGRAAARVARAPRRRFLPGIDRAPQP